MILKRMKTIWGGRYVDAPRISHDDRVFDIPKKLSKAELAMDFVPYPLPKMSLYEKCRQIINQAYILLCALPLPINTNYKHGQNK